MEGKVIWKGLEIVTVPAGSGTEEASGSSALPYQVTADPDLRVDALEPKTVTIPVLETTGSDRRQEREVLIRWMAAYGQQFYALPEGDPWKAADVKVAPTPFYWGVSLLDADWSECNYRTWENPVISML